MKRPIGVTILAILVILGGVGLIGALLLFILSAAIAGVPVPNGFHNLSAGSVITVGAVALVLGALDIVWGIGALQLRPWAWMLGIALGVLNILGSGLNLVVGRGLQPSDFISVVLAVIIIVYFFTPRVRRAFGRA
jgi:hypothetical protein